MSDTHVPGRARALPARLWEAVGTADVVVHAGDWVSESLLDELLAHLHGDAARLIGVHGNNDGPELRRRLPEVARAAVGGVRLAVVHETGDARGREARCAARFGGPGGGADGSPAGATDVLVFGHSHIPWDSTAPNGLRLLNPGSPTDRRRQPHHTYMTAVVDRGRLDEVTLHRL